MNEPTFTQGQFVRKKSNPDIAGKVKKSIWDEQTGEWIYQVQFGSGLKGIPESDLEKVPVVVRPIQEIINGRFADINSFRSVITYYRLKRPVNLIAHSFGSAKAILYPYQFKPLLKFLQHPEQRILVTDDVGLGKTIEAGYILRELRARQAVQRVLVVVPARLRRKWRDELKRRFSETFDVLNRSDVRRFIKRLDQGKEIEAFLWITSYESLAKKEFIDAFNEFSFPLDLLIADEAHRMRNPESLTSQVGRALSGNADSIILLTATPIHTGLENLYELLRILSPEEFADYYLFELQMEANKPIVRALNEVRKTPPNYHQALSEVLSLKDNSLTEPLTNDQLYKSIVKRLSERAIDNRQSRITIQHDISQLSLTGHLISRTRKREVIKDPPERRPVIPEIEFSESEQRVYDAVVALEREVLLEEDSWGVKMAALMAYRQLASCMHAALKRFRTDAPRSLQEWSRIAFEETEDENAWFELRSFATRSQKRSPKVEMLYQGLSEIAATMSPPPEIDSKFDSLDQFLSRIWNLDQRENNEPRKIIIFSFFLETLKYLQERLEKKRLGTKMITGRISMEEREEIIEDFLTSPGINILLSSEVGSEGIDLQKAGVVVNYDLPWNPMVVEQRIGRVDRIGQRNPVIHIANMVVQGTIEERILSRLYYRIGIFTDTIGEIDPILGQKVQELAVDVLLDRLTEEEKDKRIEEASLIVQRIRETTRAIGEQADDLLAADQAFLDELNALIDRRRLPLKSELYNFFKNQMEKMYAGVRISPNLIQGVDDIRLPNDAAIDLQKKITHDTDAARVSEIVLRGPFKSTFEQEKAIDFPRAELIHANHPLMKLAIHSFEQRLQEYPRVFLLDLASEDVEPTRYIMCTYLYSIEGVAERVILRPFVLRLNDHVLLEESLSEDIFIQVLERGLSPQQRPRWGDQELTILEKALDKLDQEAARYRGLLQHTEGQIEQARLSRRKITIENTLQRKIDQARARLRDLQKKEAAQFAIDMARAKLQRRLAEKKERMGQLPNAATLSVHYEKLTTGVLEIGRE